MHVCRRVCTAFAGSNRACGVAQGLSCLLLLLLGVRKACVVLLPSGVAGRAMRVTQSNHRHIGTLQIRRAAMPEDRVLCRSGSHSRHRQYSWPLLLRALLSFQLRACGLPCPLHAPCKPRSCHPGSNNPVLVAAASMLSALPVDFMACWAGDPVVVRGVRGRRLAATAADRAQSAQHKTRPAGWLPIVTCVAAAIAAHGCAWRCMSLKQSLHRRSCSSG